MYSNLSVPLRIVIGNVRLQPPGVADLLKTPVQSIKSKIKQLSASKNGELSRIRQGEEKNRKEKNVKI